MAEGWQSAVGRSETRVETKAMPAAKRSFAEWMASESTLTEPVSTPTATLTVTRAVLEATETRAARLLRVSATIEGKSITAPTTISSVFLDARSAGRSLEALTDFVRRHPRLAVLTGAGCSEASGLPGYRDAEGAWKSRPPVRFSDFVEHAHVRRRYWSRSLLGWPRGEQARPNSAHRALAQLEATGRVRDLITQNVDGLHQKAGSRRVIDLHGRLDTVECLGCGRTLARRDMQQLLVAWNPGFGASGAGTTPARPDGDAPVERELASFRVPDCPACGGVLKPAVVFFGENVPRTRVEAAMSALAEADALLVVGSSLMVFSGYRFCLAARERRQPLAALNLGRTRADGMLALKVEADCVSALSLVTSALLGDTARETAISFPAPV